MTKPTTTICDFIAEFQSQIQAAAEVSSKAEAALILAEQAAEQAGTDDGTIEPAALIERAEAARKVAGIRRVEANRANANLAALEEEFRDRLDRVASDAIKVLQDRTDQSQAEISAKIEPLLADGERYCSSMNAFIESFNVYRNRMKLESQLREYAHEMREQGGNTSNLANLLSQAAALL